MPFAISLYLRLDRYKLLPWHRRPSITRGVDRRASEFASFSTRPRLPKLLRLRTPYYRHAPCPKYDAQMTTMMNTPRGIQNAGLHNRLAHADDHLCQDRLAEGHRRGFVSSRSTGRTVVGNSRANPPILFLIIYNTILIVQD